jgi:hypothetical protein
MEKEAEALNDGEATQHRWSGAAHAANPNAIIRSSSGSRPKYSLKALGSLDRA